MTRNRFLVILLMPLVVISLVPSVLPSVLETRRVGSARVPGNIFKL